MKRMVQLLVSALVLATLYGGGCFFVSDQIFRDLSQVTVG